ncbi:MAG: GNAT family N-acetyltransferase [Pseudohongiellaceae bacterium]
MKEVTIREAGPADTDRILQFIRELAVYEKAPDAVKATEKDIRDALFGEQATAHGLICSVDGIEAGFAVYFYNFSTWLGRPGIYLEDVYVTPECRGAGAGTAILKYLARLAVTRRCGRLEWSVLDWNMPAIRFYESLGAVAQDEWIGYRLTGEALESLAAGNDQPA